MEDSGQEEKEQEGLAAIEAEDLEEEANGAALAQDSSSSCLHLAGNKCSSHMVFLQPSPLTLQVQVSFWVKGSSNKPQ